MNDFQNAQARGFPSSRPMDMAVDAGLRAFMLGIYQKMGLGLVLSGVLAMITSQYPPVRDMLFTANGGYTMMGMIVAFSPMVILLGSMFGMKNPSATGASFLYWTIVVLIGAGLGAVGLRYTGESVARVFFITAAAFGALSLWGYTTKKDLTGFGSFLIMGLFGLIIASVVNIFLASSALQFAISAIGVLVFSGLIAFDTQRLKFTYYELGGNATALSVATSFGALSLYLNFINLFQMLMSLLGDRE
jgi:FtsH-binding integral membrane protein